MAADPFPESIYVVRVDRVAYAVGVLLERDIHPWFIAYLHLRRQAFLQGTFVGVRPDWAELSETLFVPGGPPKRPHLRPFWTGGKRQANQEWLNANLAGSYAPSSIRNIAFNVLEVDSQRRFVFKDSHAELALRYFLGGERLPVLPLAAFLFRDRGIVSSVSSDSDLITVFRQEYGYRDRDEGEYQTLYDEDWEPAEPREPWLEPWVEPEVDDEADPMELDQ